MENDPKKQPESQTPHSDQFEKPEINIIEIEIDEVVYAWDTT